MPKPKGPLDSASRMKPQARSINSIKAEALEEFAQWCYPCINLDDIALHMEIRQTLLARAKELREM